MLHSSYLGGNAEEKRAATASQQAAALQKKKDIHAKHVSAARLCAEVAASKAVTLCGQLEHIKAAATATLTANPQK